MHQKLKYLKALFLLNFSFRLQEQNWNKVIHNYPTFQNDLPFSSLKIRMTSGNRPQNWNDFDVKKLADMPGNLHVSQLPYFIERDLSLISSLKQLSFVLLYAKKTAFVQPAIFADYPLFWDFTSCSIVLILFPCSCCLYAL